MTKKELITAFFMLVLTLSVTITYAQNSNNDLIYNMPVTMDLGNVQGYVIHLPPGYENNPNREYPLLVFLHGSGAKGNGSSDLYKVVANAPITPPKHVELQGDLCFTVDNEQECFIVISPQLVTTTRNWTAFNQRQFWDYIMNDSPYRIDTNRIYLTGYSLGANGTWEGAYDRNDPNRFAAIAPVAAWGNRSKACNIADKEIPVWAFHGEDDNTSVSFQGGLNMFNAVKACPRNPDVELRFSALPGIGHNNVTTPAYSIDGTSTESNLYLWLLSKTKDGSSAPETVPDPPSALVSPSVSASTINLEWTDNATNESGFTLERSLVSGSGYNVLASVGANVTSFTDEGLSASTTYYYRVKAFNSLGSSAYSNELMVSTSAPETGNPVIWTNINGAVQVGDDLIKTANFGWGNSGAESTESIPSNTDGWIEISMADVLKADLAFGLSETNTDDNQVTIQYGFEASSSNTNIWKRENSTRVYLGKYAEGDILRVERVGNTIQYKMNGDVLTSTNGASTQPLIADAALLRTDATIFDARLFNAGSGGTSSRQIISKPAAENIVPEPIVNGSNGVILNMYPNPLYQSNVFSVQLGKVDFSKEIRLLVFDNLGRQIHHQRLTRSNSQIDLKSLRSSIYFVKILSNDKMIGDGRLLKFE